MGFLPNMIMIPKEELILDDFPEVITERFIPAKGKYHFVFLTSGTGYFNKFEMNYYQERILSKEEYNAMKYQLQTKIDKELNKEKVKKSMKEKDLFKLKEYDNLKNTLLSLLKNNFPYVSYVIGGYEAVHMMANELELSLLDHEEKECQLCKIEKKVNKTENKKKSSIFSKVFKIFSKKKSEVVNSLWKHHIKYNIKELNNLLKDINHYFTTAVLLEFQGCEVEEKKSGAFLIIQYDSPLIYIFQFDKKNYNSKVDDNADNSNNDLVVESNQLINEVSLLEKIPFSDISSIKKMEDKKHILIISYYPSFKDNDKTHKNKKNRKRILLDLTNNSESNKFLKIVRDLHSKKNK